MMEITCDQDETGAFSTVYCLEKVLWSFSGTLRSDLIISLLFQDGTSESY